MPTKNNATKTCKKVLFLSVFLIVAITSCKREMIMTPQIPKSAVFSAKGAITHSTQESCVEDTDDGSGYDSLLKPTILGNHLINHPYSLAHMQQAYTYLYGNANGVTVTNKYVRFKPSSPSQLSTLEDLDIDLFDYPLDYDVIQHGDYYDDGVTPAEDIPWLYAVVDANFAPPSGITYEMLEEIHVPTLAAVENQAFAITGNPNDDPDCSNSFSSTNSVKPNPDVLECPEGYHWDFGVMDCVEDNCPEGYYWDGTQCVQSGPTTPPAPSPSRVPSGNINVFDDAFNDNRPVQVARVVTKRFLKIQRMYTDAQGNFSGTKEFNKVHILVKFKNDQARIRSLRRARLWQMLFPVEKNFGKFSGNLSNRPLNIGRNANARTDGARVWAAAMVHNNVQEYYAFALQQSIGAPPGNLRILLTNWRSQGVAGATPMYAKRVVQELPEDFIRFYFFANYNILGPLAPWAYVLKQEVDICAGYNRTAGFVVDQTAVASDLSETMFHEITHAAHYNKVGNSWWNDLVDGELNNIVWHRHDNPPYGLNNQGAVSEIIALGESWGYHMGHFLADLKYGANSSETFWQQITYLNNQLLEGGNPAVFTGLNAQVNMLEDFDNHRTGVDPDAWIPIGLYYDLIDNRNDNNAFPTRVALDDNVSSYTNQQFFNALDADIVSMPNFRVRLLNENGNNQATSVNTIFTFYNVF